MLREIRIFEQATVTHPRRKGMLFLFPKPGYFLHKNNLTFETALSFEFDSQLKDTNLQIRDWPQLNRRKKKL